MPTVRRLLAAAFCLAAFAAAGCGTDAMGTDACRKIEQARCRRGASCPALNLQGGTGVEECVQFARDRCLHGLPIADPGPAVVDPCVTAIAQAATCDVVISPEQSPACAFLMTIPSGDAGTDASEAAIEPAPADASPDLSEGG